MDLTEIVIGSKEIYNGKVVHLRVDTVRLPDGYESKREIVQHPGAVCIVPVDNKGNILFVRQFRLAAGQVLLELPAGTMEAGEDPDDCAMRELEEETGFIAGKMESLFSAFMAPGYSSELIRFYLATELSQGTANPDEGENLELIEIPITDIEQKVLTGEFKDSKTISGLLVALRLLSNRKKDIKR